MDCDGQWALFKPVPHICSVKKTVERVFLETVAREGLIPDGSAVTAAVSGGADSMAMLHLLMRFAPSRGWRLDVVHIDHGLRVESREDADFVARTCRAADIPCRVLNPPEEPGGSMESRWSTVRQAVYSGSSSVVAVGHTGSDRAETLILRLVEGSGLRGLGGMDYRGRGPVVRPMLDLHRDQVREYLIRQNLPWREDATNQDQSPARNRIRLRVMPVLEDCFPGAVEGLARSASILSTWRDLQEMLGDESDSGIPRGEYIGSPPALRLVLLWSLAGKPRSGLGELKKTDAWIMSGGTGEHLLPGGLKLTVQKDALLVSTRKGRFR